MTVLSLGFLNDEYNQIKSMLSSEASNEEFEIRFGKMMYGKKSPYFDTNFTQPKFMMIINKLDYLNLHIKKEQTVDIVEYKGRYRKITSENGNIIYENKIKGKTVDINVVGEFYEDRGIMNGVESCIRFSKAIEQPLTEYEWNNIKDQITLSVKRIRSTYFMGKYKVDMTAKVYPDKTVYEVEVEFNNDIQQKENFISFMGELKNILSLIYSVSTVYSISFFNSIIREINSIKYPADIRPKNISDEDVLSTRLEKYAVTNKLDGVGYNITFIQVKIANTEMVILLAYNSTDIFSISTIKAETIEDRRILKSFSKAEIKFMPQSTQVHFFDNLLYGTEITFERDLFYRLNKSIEINNICIKYFTTTSIPVSYEVKAFEIPKGDIIESMKTVVDRMSDRYDVFDLVDYNDGIIFQPLYTQSPALKWKFPSKVTIDFLFKKSYESDTVITYKLYSKVKPGTFVPFKDEITNTEHVITVYKNETFDGILGKNLEDRVVEVGVENKEWVIHRIRFDKVPEKTNHIKTAHATFIDIVYPFTLPYLEQLIKYARKETLEKPTKEIVYLKKQEDIETDDSYFPKGKGYSITSSFKEQKLSVKDNELIVDFIKESIKRLNYNSVGGIIDVNPLVGSTAMTFSNNFERVYVVEPKDGKDVLEDNLNVFYRETGRDNIYVIDSYENMKDYKADIIFVNNMPSFNPVKGVLTIVRSLTKKNDADFSKGDLYAYYSKPKKGLENLRLLANDIKRKMIETVKGKTVVDIGAGVGGDLFKYSKTGVKQLFLIEPSETNIKEMKERIANNKHHLKSIGDIKILKAGGEEYDKICSFVNKKVDFVNMFFSLTFFFKNKKMLSNLVETIDCMLGEDGVFMGTVMDGNLVSNELEKENIKSSQYEIVKLGEGKGFYGNEISIDFKDTVTATYQKEYLVYLVELERLLASKGIYLEEIMNFENQDLEKLSPEERFLNSLYSSFVFKRKGPSFLESNLIPIRKNGELVEEFWYRRQSPGDGSCLFHSVIMNLFGENINPKLAYDIRTVLSRTFSLQEYTNIQDGNLAVIRMHDILLNKLTLSCFTPPENMTNESLNKIVEGIIEKYSNYRIPELRDVFINTLIKEGFVKEEVEEVFKGFYISSYLEFSSNLANPNYWADQSVILLLAEKLKINIVLISSSNFEVYKYTENYNPNYISIVLFYIDDHHFEPLSKKNNPYSEEHQYTFSLDELKSIF
jgi:SAM-dependent methyltransferase